MNNNDKSSYMGDIEDVKQVIKSLNDPSNVISNEINPSVQVSSDYSSTDSPPLTESITVLYVDADTSSHLEMIRKVGDRFIQLRSCFTGKEALELLTRQKFDVIMCELSLPDVDTFYIIEQYAARMPIVITSAFEDPERIKMAEKAGAVGFIAKTYSGLRIIISLYTAIDKWKKYDDYAYKKRLINNPHVKEVLQTVMNTPAKQQVKHDIWYDNLTLETTATNTKILESLVDAGYIGKEQTEMTLSCPHCNSINLTPKYGCPNCGESNFSRGTVLEHKCGFTEFENRFIKPDDGKLVCPKCNKELKTLGVDYFKMDSAFRCQKCSNVSITPDTRYRCNDCDHQDFRISEGNWTPLYGYSLKPEMFAEIKQNTISLDQIKEFLSSKGFQLDYDNKIGITQPELLSFDLVAQKPGIYVVGVIMGSYIEENFMRLVKLGTLPGPIDTKIFRFALMFSKPTDVTKYLLKKFDIFPIVTEDETDMLLKFKGYYSNVIKGM